MSDIVEAFRLYKQIEMNTRAIMDLTNQIERYKFQYMGSSACKDLDRCRWGLYETSCDLTEDVEDPRLPPLLDKQKKCLDSVSI